MDFLDHDELQRRNALAIPQGCDQQNVRLIPQGQAFTFREILVDVDKCSWVVGVDIFDEILDFFICTI